MALVHHIYANATSPNNHDDRLNMGVKTFELPDC
jgi:hypothetical protein